MHSLAALQTALSLVLLAGAGLFAVSLNRLYETDAGFRAENVLLANIDPRASGYNNVSGEERNAFHLRLLDELPALPEVYSISLSHVGLMQGSWQGGRRLRRPDEIVDGSREDRRYFNDQISPGFFETAGIALLAGRDFTTHDLPETPRVLILNRTAAETLFPNRSGIGEPVQLDDSGDAYQVVGIVENSKRNSLQDDDVPFLYFPLLQNSSLGWYIVARTAPSESSAEALRQRLARIAPDMLVHSVTTLERSVEDTLTQQRLLAGLTTCFGGLALFLAAIGLYGLLSFLVRRRTAEIGLRMALGARESQVVGLVAGQASAVVGLGLAGGLAATLLLAPIIRSFLYNLEPRDPWTIAGAVVVLAAVAAISAFLPARRAARLSPSLALRCD
jgi:predicted permease